MNSKKLFVLLALSLFFAKFANPASKAEVRRAKILNKQETKQANNSKASLKADSEKPQVQNKAKQTDKQINSNDKTIFEDNNLKVTLKEVSEIIQSGDTLQNYVLSIQNLSNQTTQVTGNVFNRVSKSIVVAQARQSLANEKQAVRRKAAGYGFGIGYYGIPLVGFSTGQGVSFNNPLKAINPVNTFRGPKEYRDAKSNVSQASRLSSDNNIERELPPGDSYTINFALNSDFAEEPKMAFEYSTGKSKKTFNYGIDSASAKELLALNEDYVDRAFLNNKLSKQETGVYLQDATTKAPIKAKKVSKQDLSEAPAFSSKGFKILVYQNIKGEPSANARWTLTSSKAKTQTAKNSPRGSMVALTSNSVKPGIVELESKTALQPAMHYVLQSSDKKQTYEFNLN